MSTLDGIIIGGGVAGSCAAMALAQRGAEVALLEAGSFPRHKVCGEFFSPESRAVLQRLGIEEILLQNGARLIPTARVVTARHTLTLPLPGAALALSRFRMDELLWRAVREAGVLCREETRVKVITRATHGWNIETAENKWRAASVIQAGGRKSMISPSGAARHFGLKAHFRGARLETGVVELHPWRGGYCGLVRVEDDLTNVCLLARYENWHKVSRRVPENFWNWILSECPALRERVEQAQRATPWLATGNVTFGREEPVRDGIMRCGDAAGYIHPLAGDGMAMAARSGELAATVIAAQLRGGLSTLDSAQLYAAAWQREFSARLRWSSRVAPLLMHPLLTAPVMSLLSAWPAPARSLVGKTRT